MGLRFPTMIKETNPATGRRFGHGAVVTAALGKIRPINVCSAVDANTHHTTRRGERFKGGGVITSKHIQGAVGEIRAGGSDLHDRYRMRVSCGTVIDSREHLLNENEILTHVILPPTIDGKKTACRWCITGFTAPQQCARSLDWADCDDNRR